MIVPEISTPSPPDPVDDIHPSSPTSSSASDSDAYNTESARLYFGPLKTPERKFVARTERLFPPHNHTAILRRSPRLSSPRLRSTSPSDLQAAEEKADMELVAHIVNDMEVDDDDLEEDEEEEVSGSLTHTPGSGLVPDEPSSVLAEKISRAMDNPSPPPSPPPFLSIFDPYHTSNLASSNNQDQQRLTLKAKNLPQPDMDDPLLMLSESEMERPASPLPPAIFTRRQSDLISFSTPPQHIGHSLSGRSSPLNSLKPSSVDDLLKSPEALKLPDNQQQGIVPIVVVELDSKHLSSMDTSTDFPPQQGPGQVAPEPKNSDCSDSCSSMAQLTVEDGAVTPLRRSPRPRRSVTPNPPPPVVVTAPPSDTRTQPKKRKGRVSIADHEIVNDSQDEDSIEQSHLNTPSRSRQRSPGKVSLSFHRELGSLSPTSSSVLSKLGFTPDPEANEDTDVNHSAVISPMLSFSVFQTETVPVIPSTPALSGSPIRFSPSRNISSSPNKFKLHTPAPNDPTNTPARRIPIEEAVSQGQLSPKKAIQLGFSPNGMLPSVPTPARRVPIAKHDASSSKITKPLLKPTVLRFGSPAKGKGKERERSAEPVIRVFAGKGKAKAQEQALDSQESNSLSSSLIKPGQLPFPLVAAKNDTAPLVSDGQKSGNDNSINSNSTPLKSNLKQTTSKIPRIGVKPYSRSTESKPMERVKATAALRMVDLSKPSSRKLPLSASSAKASLPHVKAASTSTTRAVRPTVSTSSSDLKRKREIDKSSPVKPRTIRQVLSKPIIALNPPGTIAPASDSSSGKNMRVSQPPPGIRRVVDPEPAISHIPSPPPSQESLPQPHTDNLSQSHTKKPSNELPNLLPNSDDISPGSPMQQDPPTITSPPLPDLLEPSPVSEPPAPIPSPERALAIEKSSLRRTTRSRRTLNVEDVSEVASRPSNSRRRAMVSRSDDVFSGMSMTALKDLTTSNTVRNQRYLAAKLETEVIRREGVRPESPVVKIRTISQRQQDEKEKQRAERAKRRARRSEDMASSDVEESSQVGYSSPCEDQSDGRNEGCLPKHQRGPGDEEDYETPERSTRVLKRTRLFDTGEAQECEQPRRVKWDRGLFTTVYIDEVKLGTRQTLKENRDLKGILAPTAKALRLDTLGNLPQTESPLSDLVQENVTVKKFVYDSDIPPVQEPVVKNTRSKSRKR